jgi:hypothetical protein
MNDERAVEDREHEEGAEQAEQASSEPAAEEESSRSPSSEDGALLSAEQNEQLTNRWSEIQASFVDKPQEAVEEADALVADLMQRVTASLATEREGLERQWAAGDDVSTEDLRVALTRYRTFFDRLLKT